MNKYKITLGVEEVPGADDVVLFALEVSVDPSDPGCRYTRNGDGWPPVPAHVDEMIVRVSPMNKAKIDDVAAAIAWMEGECEKAAMLERIEDQINKDDTAARGYAEEMAFEYRREMRGGL